MLLILLALLVYSALVIWSASGRHRHDGAQDWPDRDGAGHYGRHGADPATRLRRLGPYLYIFCIILLVAVDAFGAISKGAQRWLDLGVVRFQPSEIAKIAVPLMVARFINRDVCPPSLKTRPSRWY